MRRVRVVPRVACALKPRGEPTRDAVRMDKVVDELRRKERPHRSEPAWLVGPRHAGCVALMVEEHVELLKDALGPWHRRKREGTLLG